MKCAHFSMDQIRFDRRSDGIVEMSFGPTAVRFSLDAALDFQYELAGFLAQVESELYAAHAIKPEPAVQEDNLYHLFETVR